MQFQKVMTEQPFKFSFLVFLLLSLFLALMFSPYIAILILFTLMFLFNVWLDERFVVYCLPILVVLLAYLACSRGIFLTEKDDLSDYYENFLVISRGNYFGLFEFGNGIEIGFPLISLVLSLIHPFAPPREFLFFHLLVIFSLYFLFIYKSVLRYVTVDKYAVFFIFISLFIGYTAVSNLLRQSYASVFLFSLFFERKEYKKYLIIAILFHYSSLILYFLFKFIINQNYKRFFVFTIGCGLFYFLYSISLVTIFSEYQYLKLDAYLNGDGVDFMQVMYAYKEFLIVFIMLVFYRLNNKNTNMNYIFSILSFFVITVVLELMLSGISLRINHFVISFLVGPILYIVFSRNKYLSVAFCFLIVPIVLAFKVYSFASNKDDMSLFSDGHYWYESPMSYIDFVLEDIPNNKRLWKNLNYN